MLFYHHKSKVHELKDAQTTQHVSKLLLDIEIESIDARTLRSPQPDPELDPSPGGVRWRKSKNPKNHKNVQKM